MRKKTPCPEGAKQVSPGQSDAVQPRSAALGKRPTPHVRRPEGQRCEAFFLMEIGVVTLGGQ